MARRKKHDDEQLEHDEHHDEVAVDEEESPADHARRKKTIMSEQVIFPLGKQWLDDHAVTDANGHYHRSFHHYDPAAEGERVTKQADFIRLLNGSKQKKKLAAFAQRYALYEQSTRGKKPKANEPCFAFALVAAEGQINMVVSCHHAFPGLTSKKVLSILSAEKLV